jgi:hypothetical protein
MDNMVYLFYDVVCAPPTTACGLLEKLEKEDG